MTFRSIALVAAFALVVTSLGPISASAQEPFERTANDAVHLFESLRESDRVSPSAQRQVERPTVSELRIARGQYQAQQRLARLERNAWNRYQPLRPNWSSIPMTSSRFPTRTTIIVPVFVPSR